MLARLQVVLWLDMHDQGLGRARILALGGGSLVLLPFTNFRSFRLTPRLDVAGVLCGCMGSTRGDLSDLEGLVRELCKLPGVSSAPKLSIAGIG